MLKTLISPNKLRAVGFLTVGAAGTLVALLLPAWHSAFCNGLPLVGA